MCAGVSVCRYVSVYAGVCMCRCVHVCLGTYICVPVCTPGKLAVQGLQGHVKLYLALFDHSVKF